MKLKHSLLLLPLALGSFAVNAETTSADVAAAAAATESAAEAAGKTPSTAQSKAENKGSNFHFSTQVSRTVEKDLMNAEVFSRKSGKNLAELKKSVSTNLNKVLELAKKDPSIEVFAEGITNYADYDQKGKVSGWVAEGRIQLKSKNFDAVANILENLGNDDVAIAQVEFSVSPEKMASLEDEMTLEIIKQFQHKAEVIQKGLNAKKFVLSDIQLSTPNGDQPPYVSSPRMYEAKAMSLKAADASLPLEAGRQTISATASGTVTFE